jgi:DNA-directed RNA polymerase specialized sigma24 family protein
VARSAAETGIARDSALAAWPTVSCADTDRPAGTVAPAFGLNLVGGPVPEPPIYDDDESFWEWFQPVGDAHPEFALELLDRDIPGLSPLARQVLVLRRVHGLTFAEIASGLRIPSERLSQLWREGRTRLADATRRK